MLRPDGNKFEIYFAPLPSAMQGKNEFAGKIFFRPINSFKITYVDMGIFLIMLQILKTQVMIFSDTHENKVLKGTYVIRQVFYLFDQSDSIENSGLILRAKSMGS